MVDVGSNSVRMVVFEGGRRCPAIVFNEKVMCGLGADLHRTGRLSPDGIDCAIQALRRFVALAPGLQVGALAAVATAAVRNASDGSLFCRRVVRETNIRLDVASGEDEARLAALGVLFGDPAADGLVVDLGGASMELCAIKGGKPGEAVSLPLGHLQFAALSRSKTEALIADTFKALKGRLADLGPTLYLVGGTWRALGRLQINRLDHPMPVLHEFAFSAGEAAALAAEAQGSSPEALASMPGVSSNRVQALPHAGLLLDQLLQRFGPDRVAISGFGLREGVCFECLPAAIRRQDPLMSTCTGQERTRARAPGFGADLAAWLLAAIPAESPEEERLIRAACHLSDVSWRAHPDYRAKACIEVVTRVNVSGVGHVGRAFMGAMLIARYKGGRRAMTDEPALQLLDKAALDRAIALGAAMRLGATLAGATPGFLPLCPLVLEGGTLRLSPTPEAEPIMGAEVSKRLSQAAKALQLDWETAA
ncbi:MAG: exopolyphosphatase [Pseudomonadota bacterium]